MNRGTVRPRTPRETKGSEASKQAQRSAGGAASASRPVPSACSRCVPRARRMPSPAAAPRLVILGMVGIALAGAPLLLMAAYHGARGVAVEPFSSQAAALRRLALEQRNGIAFFAVADGVLGLCFFAQLGAVSRAQPRGGFGMGGRHRAHRLRGVQARALDACCSCFVCAAALHARLEHATHARSCLGAALRALRARLGPRCPPHLALACVSAAASISPERSRTAAAAGRDFGWARGSRPRRPRRCAKRRIEGPRPREAQLVTRDAAPTAAGRCSRRVYSLPKLCAPHAWPCVLFA